MSLTFQQLREANSSRVVRWHGDKPWSTTDWSNASAGEMGEVCNAVKKLRRIEDELPNINLEEGHSLTTKEAALDKIAKEIADTIIYLDLLAYHLGIDVAMAVKYKFNKKSAEYNFLERL